MPDPVVREFLLAFWKIHILHHASEQGVYGQWMLEELNHHGYRLSPGTLYPILHGLEENGVLHSEELCIGGKIRRVYRTTSDGQRVLLTAKEKVQELFGELFEDEPVAQLARTRPRVISVQAARYRKRSVSKAAL